MWQVPPFLRQRPHHRMKVVKYLSWLLRALIFAALLWFALKNTDAVTLRFFLGQSWETPLIVALLVFFVFGAILGVMACLSRLFQQRREIASLKRAARAQQDSERIPPQTLA